ncbi:MAG: hypothetical protein MZV63_63325 [Marinilabiliales bacterium]|nr:hypothetical protein [Marinilabiliales bacterium]
MAGQVLSSFVLAMILGGSMAFLWSLSLSLAENPQELDFHHSRLRARALWTCGIPGLQRGDRGTGLWYHTGKRRPDPSPDPRKMDQVRPSCLNDTEKIFFSGSSFSSKHFSSFTWDCPFSSVISPPISSGSLITAILFLVRVPIVKWSTGPSISSREAATMAVAIIQTVPPLPFLPRSSPDESGRRATIQAIVYAVVLFSILGTSVLVFSSATSALVTSTGLCSGTTGRTEIGNHRRWMVLQRKIKSIQRREIGATS